MVWTTEKAAEELAKYHLRSASNIQLTLRAIGFRDTAPNLNRVLEYASFLSERFLYLQTAFPQWAESIGFFIDAGELSKHLALTTYDEEEGANSKDDPLSHLLNMLSLGDYPRKSRELEVDLLAVVWLLERLAVLHNIKIYGRFPDYSTVIILSNTDHKIESRKKVDAGLCAIGLEAWIQSLFELSNSDYAKLHESVAQECAALVETLKGLSNTAPTGKLALANCSKPAPRLPLVDERECTDGQWYYPRPSEFLNLRRATLATEETASGYLERLILSIALATGHTIAEVLNMPLVGANHARRETKKEQIELRLIPAHNGTKRYFSEWRIPLGSNHLNVPLPDFFDRALRSLMTLDTDARLIDRLPPTTVDWKTRCESVLVSTLECSLTRAESILRDTLIRTCYHLSSNRAIGYWLTAGLSGDTNQLRASQVSLSHYLDPEGRRTKETLQHAWKIIFGKYGASERLAHHRLAHSIATIPQEAVVKELRNRLASVDKTNVVDLHNAFAEYTLFLLIVATGHRKSTTPFFFSWDVFTTERLAFIADKCIVGSEARFIPLADTAIDQFNKYLLHLRALYQRLESSSPIKKHIANIICLSRFGSGTQCEQTYGQFFRILGNRIETISTGSLDRMFVRHPEIRIGRFRPAIAEYLWTRGLSGMEISAFLGHANDFHPFGSASHWSVMNWADKCRPLINDYLSEHGWKAVDSPLVRANGVRNTLVVALPSLVAGNQSYEGRMRQRVAASERALQVLRTILTDEFLEGQDLVLDDDTISRIRDAAMTLLADDRDAREAFSRTLADRLVKFRRQGIRIRSIFPNIYKSAPSPISIGFGRKMAIANMFRATWLDHMGEPIGGALDTLERAAHLAINLIALEGRLDPNIVKGAIVNLLAERGLSIYDGMMTLRTDIETQTHEYQASIVLGELSSAMTLGLVEKIQQAGPSFTPHSIKQLDERIDKICCRIAGRYPGNGAWSINHLVEVFQPWWFIRQPGFLHSIARGLHHGPAPHPLSEASLFAASEVPALPLEKKYLSVPTGEQAIALATDQARMEIQSLLRQAAGRTESATAHTRIQRKRLKQGLVEITSPELAPWATRQQIVDLLLSFTRDLLESGGPRKRSLAFNSIKTYLLSVLGSLIKLAWDYDFSDMSAEHYRSLYKAVEDDQKQKRTDWHLVLRMFHQHLRNKIGAPFLTEYTVPRSGLRKRCRSTVITSSAIDAAFVTLSRDNELTSEQREAAKVLLALAYGYALRQKECVGLTTTSFDPKQDDYISVQANVIRGLKSASSRRNIPCGMLNQKQTRVLKAQLRRTELAPRLEKYLFGASDRNDEILKVRPIVRAVIEALRVSTGNRDAVFHDLRRTTATRMVLSGLPLVSNCPILRRAKERLIGDEKFDEAYVHSMTSTVPGNPYFIDGVARTLGHESEDTLLNTYFHGSSILLADIAIASNLDIKIDDSRLASMLNKERTSIVKLRQRLAKQGLPVSARDLIRHYIRKMPPKPRSASDSSSRLDSAEDARLDNSNYLVLFDRLLCARKREAISLNEMLERCDDLDISNTICRQLVDNYRKLVSETGFDDFEPEGSELVCRKPKHGNGLLRGQNEREITLQRISFKNQKQEDFFPIIKNLCESWFLSLTPDSPRLVCRETTELDNTLDALLSLGATRTQIKAEAIGDVSSPIIQMALERFPTLTFRTSGRISRGPKSVRVTEVGLSIQQEANSAVPDGRDFHRLLAILFCLISTT
jgi:site-specific recombinase XerD